MVRLAVIVGSEGQDGRVLKSSLDLQGIDWIGLGRNFIVTSCYFRYDLPSLIDIRNFEHVSRLIELCKPDEVYYLAAYHKSSQDVGDSLDPIAYDLYHSVNVIGLLNFLCAIRQHSSSSRLFYAGSSLVFSGEDGVIQNENTKYAPEGFYGLTKAQGILLCREFRSNYGVYASAGILYNHESALRSESFLSKRVITAAYRIKLGLQNKVSLGNLSAEVDWGYALDYIDAFQRILRIEHADEFIISTGESHTVREFVSIIFDYFGLDYLSHVVEDVGLLNRNVLRKVGDNSKLKTLTGWNTSLSFSSMVRKLVDDCISTGVLKI